MIFRKARGLGPFARSFLAVERSWMQAFIALMQYVFLLVIR